MGTEEKSIKLVLVDDHVLLRNGLANHIRSLDRYEVLFEADNGVSFIKKLDIANLPELVLMDINMPEMDGHETTQWLKQNHPQIKVLALSMYDNEQSIIRMLKSGAKGYILKDIDPAEFKTALDSVSRKGYYYSELVTGKLIHAVNAMNESADKIKTPGTLTLREIEFLKLCCTEMTYKEIADKMYLSPRTIDGYRDDLFEKLNVRTRIGLVIFAIRSGIVNL
jgi:two-component system, NarL family, invasion response regulator UvrY